MPSEAPVPPTATRSAPRPATALRDLSHRFFIEGLTGMAHGLFATLIIGTILSQAGAFLPGGAGGVAVILGRVAAAITGAGIGLGVAHRLKADTFVVISAAVAGQLGAQAGGLLSGTAIVTDTVGTGLMLRGPGEPLGAFLAAYAAIEAGRLVSGRTPVDILVTPLTTIVTGGAVGLILGPPISSAMVVLGGLVNWGTERQPMLMGVIVAVIMGMVLTLPISSAALGIILDLSGIAAGAATVGCATQMVGFAVASFRENRWSGLLAQGVGTSMLQVPNIVRHPLIWVPPTLASAILGPEVHVQKGHQHQCRTDRRERAGERHQPAPLSGDLQKPGNPAPFLLFHANHSFPEVRTRGKAKPLKP